MKAPIPMSATRFKKTIEEYIRITFKGTKEEFDLHGVLESNNKKCRNRYEFCIFQTINHVAHEVLVKDGLIRDDEILVPIATVEDIEYEWEIQSTDLMRKYLKTDSIRNSNRVELFNYTEPFNATFTYIDNISLADSVEETSFLNNEISKFAKEIIKTYKN
ncbi:hypothetical protein BK720_07185 [Bacillus thuringiensis serovar brasilensis]|uniref:hypothetical protein n=1 Tax=Bacillus cereus group TaxID=86661 RepID=UPI000A3CA79F|nr:hypothetical protein [Bacillus thuringiensis]MCU5032090.1 hypothetical protein [Bacillus cereus]MRA75243.1 hypothetical protein [Bacillus thuringiensis]MRA93770.1 hypothetical protein [Bacillus thuringiensis]MRC56454.1 hypothetical protein [Bacillus thuringiensis]OTX33628.1 hypothetical protein BK720_10690 [Bacillus thuringiensis serovar brasilensis]